MRKNLLLLSIFSIPLTSCSLFVDDLPYVYKIDVNQGNVIDQTMIDQLRPNMTKKQVQFIMGSPMLVDFFHQDRWDYVYWVKKGDENVEKKMFSIFFDNDRIRSIQGDFRPSPTPAAKLNPDNTVDVPKRELDKTLWEMITD